MPFHRRGQAPLAPRAGVSGSPGAGARSGFRGVRGGGGGGGKGRYAPPNFRVRAERTTHLDMATKEMLIAALWEFEGTMLFVSHDRHFLAALSNRVLELSDDGIHQYGGGYTEY